MEQLEGLLKLVDIAKDVHCIWQYEDEESDYGDDGMSYERGRRYDGMSYARGRRNARRDSMGRYSREYRDSYDDGRSMRGYSRADSKEDYKNQLRMMMEDAPDENTRQNIKRMIDSM